MKKKCCKMCAFFISKAEYQKTQAIILQHFSFYFTVIDESYFNSFPFSEVF
jgi:hypothetical protein